MAVRPHTQEPTSDLVLERLHSSSVAKFEELVAIYEGAFPEAERKPVDMLRKMLANDGNYFLFASQDGVTVGFAILRLLSSSPTAMLEYMAIQPAQRGRGLGRRLFLAVAQAVQPVARVLVMELESDSEPGPEQQTQARRKRFYRALGAGEIMGLSWIMPPVVPAMPPPMNLMAFGVASRSVSKEQIRQWLADIYVDVYGQRADDPRIETMLADLAAETPLI